MGTQCGVVGCERAPIKRGLCNTHYLRQWKYGDVHRNSRRVPPKYVSKATVTALETPCRIYRGPLTRHGYGHPMFGQQRADGRGRAQVLLHRWIVEQVEDKPLGPGEVVMHRCDTPACFRYDHLRRATQFDNVADMNAKGRGRVPAPRRGSDNARAKLTERDVVAIRGLRALGFTSVEIAKRYDVTGACIRAAWSSRGKAWSHVR